MMQKRWPTQPVRGWGGSARRLPMAAGAWCRPMLPDQPGFYPGFYGTEQLLARQPMIDAIYYQNDNMAAGGMMHGLSKGLRIPADLGIAGWGDLPIASILPGRLTASHVAPPADRADRSRQAACHINRPAGGTGHRYRVPSGAGQYAIAVRVLELTNSPHYQSTTASPRRGLVAQGIERPPPKRQVDGSNPSGVATRHRDTMRCRLQILQF